jgi:hypothetical protein
MSTEDSKLLNKLSKLNFISFFDPSKDMVVVHFYNEEENKKDIIAYLLPSMSWDIRQVEKESSKLFVDKEIVTIHQKVLAFEPKDSLFDKMVRKGIAAQAKSEDVDIENDSNLPKLYHIIKNNSYA